MAGCLRGVEVTGVLLAAAGVAAVRNEDPHYERGTTMAAKTTSMKKATLPKQVPVEKATAKMATTKKPAAKKTKRKISGLDGAAKVLAESPEPMRVKEIVEQMAAKGYWKSPAGKTPQATIYSALLREIKKKGKDARFRKAERGHFVLRSAAK